ncbi:transposase-like protein [Actinoplanes couchii]|nr:transposase-like protein [Actinoplanes couchii]
MDRARGDDLKLTGEGGLLQQLTKRILESALEGEITDHVGFDKHDKAANKRENTRNGHRSKTVITGVGPVEIRVPRDVAGSFEPQIVRKRQRRLTGVDELVLPLSAKGLTHGEIAAHLSEVHGTEVSKQTISTITDKVMDGMAEWQNRGVQDVLMLVCDGLKGLPDAVETVWPKTVVQTCVVHLLRNSFKYSARQDYEKIARALKPVYTAATEDAATERFLEFSETWGGKCPALVRLWENAWSECVPFLAFDVEIRKVICTTNAIESVNARIRKAVRARGHFPNETAALKCVYMALMSLDPTGAGRRRRTMRWKAPLNAFQTAFEGRPDPAIH